MFLCILKSISLLKYKSIEYILWKLFDIFISPFNQQISISFNLEIAVAVQMYLDIYNSTFIQKIFQIFDTVLVFMERQ